MHTTMNRKIRENFIRCGFITVETGMSEMRSDCAMMLLPLSGEGGTRRGKERKEEGKGVTGTKNEKTSVNEDECGF